MELARITGAYAEGRSVVAMIDVEGLTKRYGDVTAVEDLTFQVQEGEVVGFLGVNGAGKTTTLRILACYQPATLGRATVAGHDVFRESLRVRQAIGYLPESVPLYPELRVSEYLRFRARLKGVPRSAQKAEVARVARRCKIEDRVRQTIGTLSRGYRQRVGLADALIGPPKLLILDEPTSGQDPLQRLEVRALLAELRRDHTVFLSTHILPEVEAACTRVIILHRGRLVPEREVERLRRAHRFLLSASGPAGAIREALRGLPGVASVEDLAEEKTGLEGQPELPHARFEVEPRKGADPRADLVALFAARRAEGWALLELSRRALTLEEVFARATEAKG